MQNFMILYANNLYNLILMVLFLRSQGKCVRNETLLLQTGIESCNEESIEKAALNN